MKIYSAFITLATCLILISCSFKKDGNQKQVQDTTSVKPVRSDKYDELRALDGKVKVEDIPATNIVSLSFTGNYQKHPEAYGKLFGYVGSRYRTAGGVVGIYPQDPDLVEESQLTWEIGLRVLPGDPKDSKQAPSNAAFEIGAAPEELGAPLKSLKKADSPFQLRQLPKAMCLTLVTDVAHLGADGLMLNAWMSMNNYAQTAVTRMEFGSTTEKSQAIPVKIMVPVKKRTQETIK